jgi:hypothetical protein
VNYSEEAVEYAHERLSALVLVHFNRTMAERAEAVKLVWEGLGVEDPEYLQTRTESIAITEHGSFLVGVLFGLFMAQYES